MKIGNSSSLILCNRNSRFCHRGFFFFNWTIGSASTLFYFACQEFATQFNYKRACFDKLIKRLNMDTHSITSDCQYNKKKIDFYSIQGIFMDVRGCIQYNNDAWFSHALRKSLKAIIINICICVFIIYNIYNI